MSTLLATLHTPLAVIGAAFISLTLYKLLAFIWRHFLRPSNSLKRYGADKSIVRCIALARTQTPHARV